MITSTSTKRSNGSELSTPREEGGVPEEKGEGEDRIAQYDQNRVVRYNFAMSLGFTRLSLKDQAAAVQYCETRAVPDLKQLVADFVVNPSKITPVYKLITINFEFVTYMGGGGGHITNARMLSTSLDPAVALSFSSKVGKKMIWELRVPSGAQAYFVGRATEQFPEEEVILAAGFELTPNGNYKREMVDFELSEEYLCTTAKSVVEVEVHIYEVTFNSNRS
jgi:hypothetical protein